MTAVATQVSAHEFIAANTPNQKFAKLNLDPEALEEYVAETIKHDEADTSCYPVIVLYTNGEPTAWVDLEREEGYITL